MLLKLNVRDSLEEVLPDHAGAKSADGLQLCSTDSCYFAVESVVAKQGINVLIPQLLDAGAEDILVLSPKLSVGHSICFRILILIEGL